jgi:uncharacterized membrane protein (DUF485 family)
MSTGDAPLDHHDRPEIITRNARYGLILFLAYLAVYGGFVALSAFSPELMAAPALAGVNVAVVYGFVLIGLALVLAVVYMALCGLRQGTDRS